jgi:hypothetical protein
MMTSRSVNRATVHSVLRTDLAQVGAMVRTLVSHPDLPEGHLLLPTAADQSRIDGLVVEAPVERHSGGAESDAGWAIDPEAWVAQTPPVPWRAGMVPQADGEGSFTWTTLEDRSQRALGTVASLVERLLRAEDPPSFEQIAELEHADGQLGGEPLALGALLVLHERYAHTPSGSTALGEERRLRERFHAAAPDGMDNVAQRLQHLAIRGRLSRPVEDALLGAARRADAPQFTADAWSRARRGTAWAWWLAQRAAESNKPPRVLLERWGLRWEQAARLAAGDDEGAILANTAADLPSAEARLDQLRDDLRDMQPVGARLRAVAGAHRPRLDQFAVQLAALERATVASAPLTRWREARGPLERLRTALPMRTAVPWESAKLAARMLRHALPAAMAEGPAALGPLLEALGVAHARAALPFPGLIGAFAAPADGRPVVYTSAERGGSVGAARFAALHQLGHLVAGHTGPCTRQDDVGAVNDEQEKFANAFAAYFAAPDDAVEDLVGAPVGPDLKAWSQGAARDLAEHFGLSPDAALTHLYNCRLHGSTVSRAELLSAHGWTAARERIRDRVNDRWAQELSVWCIPATSPHADPLDAALGRPQSAHFDRVLRRAVDQRMVDQDLAGQWSAA